MDWIDGVQRAVDYVEAHLAEKIDYDAAAREAASSSYHFQRVFSILTGYTLGEYIRMRRLTLAGAELAADEIKVIDAALKYGYESPVSFARAFRRFHGVNPSEAAAAALRSFSPLKISLKLEGASMLTYKIEEKPEMVLTGFKRRFTGSPEDRVEHENNFYRETREQQRDLLEMSGDLSTSYDVITDLDREGYDFYIAQKVAADAFSIYGEDSFGFERLTVPAGLYMVCETERSSKPKSLFFNELRRRAVSEWLPASGYELDARPEIAVYHRSPKGADGSGAANYIELWLPIVKKQI